MTKTTTTTSQGPVNQGVTKPRSKSKWTTLQQPTNQGPVNQGVTKSPRAKPCKRSSKPQETVEKQEAQPKLKKQLKKIKEVNETSVPRWS